GERVESVAPTVFAAKLATAPVPAPTGTSAVTYTAATLEGTIDPEGGNTNPLPAGSGPLPIEWQLQYAPLSQPESWQTANPVGPSTIEGAEAGESTPVAVAAKAEGLTQGTQYVFRVLATYAGGLQKAVGEENFETLAVTAPGVGMVTVEPGTTTAHLKGQ